MADTRRPDFKIYEDGNPIPNDVLARVIQITVDEPMGAAAVGTVKFRDEGGELSDSGKLKCGAELKIELGYVGETKQVFMGQITGWRGGFPRRGNQTLTVVAMDKFHLLRRNRRQETFLAQKDSDIIKKVAEKAGLTMGTCEATPVTQDSVIQWNISDADFILDRAQLFGFDVFCDDNNKLVLQEPKLKDGEKATIEWHKQLRHFMGVLSLTKQSKETKVKAWDMKNKKMIEFSAKKGEEVDMMGGTVSGADAIDALATEATIFDTTPGKTPEEMEAYAKAIFAKNAQKFLTGDGTCDGDPNIRRGAVVKIMGIGQYLEGPYYCVRVIHTLLKEHGYTTTFYVNRTAVKSAKPPPENYERPEPPEQEPYEPEEDGEPLTFEVLAPDGAPLEGVGFALNEPLSTERETGDLSNDGKVEIDYEES